MSPATLCSSTQGDNLVLSEAHDLPVDYLANSILFPEMPIALWLSRHLLLGVVRIYSRKVNYLFDDCIETLLKVKQAFCSTVVDLPPEESTPPYHSITLPKTFDLDDFELPNNENFQGLVAADEDDDSDVDLFGEETEEEKKVVEYRAAAVKASGKKKEFGKSSVLLDVKPWDDETNMKKLEEAVRSVHLDGLLWAPVSKLVPVGYGIKELQITMTIVDDLVSVDTVIEERLTEEPINEYVRAVILSPSSRSSSCVDCCYDVEWYRGP
ncbi:hypothetical protein L6452_32656 [Arctium lappa]|uniref:Uncharacterized protein n=1 Tax=Arctium lappa TaxID=4217 RepID=A0ACB8Z5K7_ARCLA|nr:hypothetical protein L6452_32656 [Arctium lappa]